VHSLYGPRTSAWAKYCSRSCSFHVRPSPFRLFARLISIARTCTCRNDARRRGTRATTATCTLLTVRQMWRRRRARKPSVPGDRDRIDRCALTSARWRDCRTKRRPMSANVADRDETVQNEAPSPRPNCRPACRWQSIPHFRRPIYIFRFIIRLSQVYRTIDLRQ